MKQHYKKHIKMDQRQICGHEPQGVIARALHRKFDKVPGPLVVAVGGPGGTGKTTFARNLACELRDASVLALDDYKTPRDYRAEKNIFGPHPEANQIELLAFHMAELKKGADIEKPVYCRKKGKAHEHEKFSPSRFVIAEGEIATYREFHAYVDFSVFIDSHWKTQLNTRIKRDIDERGYTPQKAIAAFLYSNLHEFPEYGEESKHWADVHIHCGEDYNMTIDAVCSKSAKFMVDDVASILADVLPPSKD